MGKVTHRPTRVVVGTWEMGGPIPFSVTNSSASVAHSRMS